MYNDFKALYDLDKSFRYLYSLLNYRDGVPTYIHTQHTPRFKSTNAYTYCSIRSKIKNKLLEKLNILANPYGSVLHIVTLRRLVLYRCIYSAIFVK